MSLPKYIGRKNEGSHPYIIEGTRVRVNDIARLYELCLQELVIERIGKALPHLSEEQIEAAVRFWREHPDEIAQEIRDEEAIMAQMPRAW